MDHIRGRIAWRLLLRELGRVERTLFTLEWLQSPELRRRVQVGLNKGEARNALARAVFFNRLAEIRDRSFENQRYRASGSNLVVASIALWNTAYLERAILALRQQQVVDDALLKHLSPLGWEHINLRETTFGTPTKESPQVVFDHFDIAEYKRPSLSVRKFPFLEFSPSTRRESRLACLGSHGEHEKRVGQRDANWTDWYAAYMVAEQSGKQFPQ